MNFNLNSIFAFLQGATQLANIVKEAAGVASTVSAFGVPFQTAAAHVADTAGHVSSALGSANNAVTTVVKALPFQPAPAAAPHINVVNLVKGGAPQ